jgi:hypothetical protein
MIMVASRKFYLGALKTEKAAAKVYDKLAIILKGIKVSISPSNNS